MAYIHPMQGESEGATLVPLGIHFTTKWDSSTFK